MKIWTDDSIRNFDFWSGGRDTVNDLTWEDFDILDSEIIKNPSKIFNSFRYLVVFEKENDLYRCRVYEVFSDRGDRWALKSATVMLNSVLGYISDLPLSYKFLNNSSLYLEV